MAADLELTLNGTPTPVYLGENTAIALAAASEAKDLVNPSSSGIAGVVSAHCQRDRRQILCLQQRRATANVNFTSLDLIPVTPGETIRLTADVRGSATALAVWFKADGTTFHSYTNRGSDSGTTTIPMKR